MWKSVIKNTLNHRISWGPFVSFGGLFVGISWIAGCGSRDPSLYFILEFTSFCGSKSRNKPAFLPKVVEFLSSWLTRSANCETDQNCDPNVARSQLIKILTKLLQTFSNLLSIVIG